MFKKLIKLVKSKLIYLIGSFSIIFLVVQLENNEYLKSITQYLINTKEGQPKVKICDVLQRKLDKEIGKINDNWSITVLDHNRNIIANINGGKTFIPASNVKLLTTAYALDILGKDFQLRTKLIKRRDGILELWGQGDPDLNVLDIKKISKQAIPLLEKRIRKNQEPKIIIYEEPYKDWWPETWLSQDRLESYGSPITRLAITSNQIGRSVENPISRFVNLLKEEISSYGITPVIQNEKHLNQQIRYMGRKVIMEIKSAPMISLLSLANSESHNFTAEILMRQASETWNSKEAAKKVYKWLLSKKIPAEKFVLVDGSGLSRNNRVTSIGLASLLWYMDNNNYGSIFKSSMAIAGLRGTLTEFNYDTSIYGNFFGKTGTLSGVRAISGILNTPENVRYVSIINNNGYQQDTTISNLIGLIFRFSQCS